MVRLPALRLTPLAPVKFSDQLAAVEVVDRLPIVIVFDRDTYDQQQHHWRGFPHPEQPDW